MLLVLNVVIILVIHIGYVFVRNFVRYVFVRNVFSFELPPTLGTFMYV